MAILIIKPRVHQPSFEDVYINTLTIKLDISISNRNVLIILKNRWAYYIFNEFIS